jgi:hypothetical protein
MLALQKDTRRFTRVAFRLPIQFHDGTGSPSDAILTNVSYGGLTMTLGRYLKPQTVVRIPVPIGEKVLFLPATVAWCVPDNNSERFRAGLRADHSGKHTMAILSSWVLDAFKEEGEDAI